MAQGRTIELIRKNTIIRRIMEDIAVDKIGS